MGISIRIYSKIKTKTGTNNTPGTNNEEYFDRQHGKHLKLQDYSKLLTFRSLFAIANENENE